MPGELCLLKIMSACHMRSLNNGLFRVFCEEVFTAEAQSSQRSENFLFKNSFTLRPEPVLSGVEGRLRGAICESCFTGKPEDPNNAIR
jgi:hypothetical protein